MRSKPFWGWIALALLAGAPALVVRAQPAEPLVSPPGPPARASLRYQLVQRVHAGSGAYEGWEDTLVSEGNYLVETGTVHAHYDWRYGSRDRTDHGTVDRDVAFDVGNRLYVDDRTDLDDYDSVSGPLATWIWIPPDVAPGDSVRVLDDTLTVVGRESVRVAGAPRASIHLHGVSTGRRDDEYGNYTTDATDDYWFDAATGMFLREERVEHDRGRYQGDRASFTMDLRVEVVDASYAVAVGEVLPAPAIPSYGAGEYVGGGGGGGGGDDPFTMTCFMLAFAGIIYVVFFVGRRLSRNPYRDSAYDVQPLPLTAPIPEGVERFSPRLGPFLAHMTKVARRSGSNVYVARARGTEVGLAIDDAEAKIVAIYTESSDAAEALRRAANRDELVSEFRYRVLDSVKKVGSATGTTVPENAYNLYETYDILTLTLAPDDQVSGYDPELVRRMRPDDVDAASRIAERVYGARCDEFFRGSLALGDIAFVAEEDGEIFGVALASVVGTSARLHSLMVDPDARQRGIGKELYRARLRACADLGVETVLTEVSQQNPAAMDLALRFGMKKIDEMYVQSARQARVEIAPAHR